MSEKPTILFVHGAWHQPAHFEDISKKLEAEGYPCVLPLQPTFGLPSSAMKTEQADMYNDAKCIRSALEKLIEQEGKEVVVAVHSYGGVVATEAVHESLGAKQRQAQGKKGGVIKLLYMCAFILPPNSSLGDAFGGKLPPFLPEEEDGACNFDDPRVRFYSGLDDDTAKHWLFFTKPHPARAQLTKLTYTAYLHHPLAYLVCTKDSALNPDIQRGMVQAMKDQGLPIDVFETDADHSPWITREADTIETLKKCAASA